MKNVLTEDLIVGSDVIIHPRASIRGISGKAKRIVIGDHSYIGENVQIICDDFEIGDYSKIHHHTNIHGYLPCKIGHNAWIGQYTIIDSIGGTKIGNNCGIGAHSQLWSHIKFGDTLEGCRFLSEKPLSIGNDVWFVGHCIVSPITAEDRSMAMVGSVVTKDMKYNNIYAGSPAISISDKIGLQFNKVEDEQKIQIMNIYLKDWGGDASNFKVIDSNYTDQLDPSITYFNISNRTYTKRRTLNEVSFIKFLLPARAKFIPIL